MKKSLFGVIASVVAGTAIAAVGNPYTGQENREIKALSPQEIEGYLNGLGMGYAKAVELNQFPGPRLGMLVSEIGALEARIRRVHLKAHLEQQALLSGHQIRLYDELRGYGGAHGNKRGHSH